MVGDKQQNYLPGIQVCFVFYFHWQRALQQILWTSRIQSSKNEKIVSQLPPPCTAVCSEHREYLQYLFGLDHPQGVLLVQPSVIELQPDALVIF